MENIELADKMARRGKHNWGIVRHNKRTKEDNEKLLTSLKNLTYKTSMYSQFKIYEPKERLISRLPYYPDRIAQWAIMNVLEPIWTKTFIGHTYSCIRDRGIHKLVKDVKKALRTDPEGTTYCLKLDIRKFYPSIDHNILKSILRRKIKDEKLLTILDEIIDSASGVPIGNYLSQFFANLYLTYFDHWLLELVGAKHYFRYADDIVILSKDEEFLKKVLILIKLHLNHALHLEIKPNYQVFEVEHRGIDFAGYVFFHSHTKLRKSIKLKMFRLISRFNLSKMAKDRFEKGLTSYSGWMKHCDSKRLLLKVERLTGIHYSNWNGIKSIISNFYNKIVKAVEAAIHSRYFQLHFIYRNKPYSIDSENTILYRKLRERHLPANFKLRKYVRTKLNILKHKA